MSDGATTKRVMGEAQKLNMVQGNFVWLWIDTSASISSLNDTKLSIFYPPNNPAPGASSDDSARPKERRIRESDPNQAPAPTKDYINDVLKFLLGERVSKNSTTNSSATRENLSDVQNETSDKSDVLSTSKKSSFSSDNENRLLPSNDAGEISIDNTTANESYSNPKDIFSSVDVKSNTEKETSLENKEVLSKSLTVDSKEESQPSSSLSLTENLTIPDEYVWIRGRKLMLNSENLLSKPDIIHSLPVPIQFLKHSNLSIFLGRVDNFESNNDSSRANRRRKQTRSAKAKSDKSVGDKVPMLPVGVLGIRAVPLKFDRHVVRSAVKLLVEALRRTLHRRGRLKLDHGNSSSCWQPSPEWQKNFSVHLVK